MSVFNKGQTVHAHRAGEGAHSKVLELAVQSFVDKQLLLSGVNFDGKDLDLFIRGKSFMCSTFRPEAMYTFEAVVGDASAVDGGFRIRLKLVGDTKRIQRRKWYRVERSMEVILQLPLENKALGESLDRSWIETWWVKAHLHNLSAGGMKLKIDLPDGHALFRHREARLRLSIQDGNDTLELRERRLLFKRIEGKVEGGVIVYAFADLSADEGSRLHKLNVRHEQQQLKDSRHAD